LGKIDYRSGAGKFMRKQPKNPLVERVGKIAAEECGLLKDRPLLVGVSGGADSLCLLDVLQRSGYCLVAAHFDHQLRTTSAEDSLRVAKIVVGKGLPLVSGTASVADYAGEYKLSIEEAARIMRYRFLFEQARLAGAQAVAVGHTADDQVETVLMHLLRGSGLAGLRGMAYRSLLPAWDETIPVVRPLLCAWRTETHAYCRENGLAPVDDASNQDLAYFRNRLRHELIPFLEGYNPNVRQVILRTSKTLAGDYSVIEAAGEKAWLDCLVQQGKGYIVLKREIFVSLLPGLQRHLMRRAVTVLCSGIRNFDMEMVEKALSFAQLSPRGRKAELTGDLHLKMKGENFFIYLQDAGLPGEDWPKLPPDFRGSLTPPGEVHLPDGWIISATVGPASGHVETFRNVSLDDPNQAWLDADSLVFPLVVRPHQRGERWQPLGMENGSIKLSDFFTNVKLERQARSGWPLIYSNDQVAWLPGFRPGHAFRVKNESSRLVHLKLTRDRQD
jgi:tRNA(Ile)-lysidine synthase